MKTSTLFTAGALLAPMFLASFEVRAQARPSAGDVAIPRAGPAVPTRTQEDASHDAIAASRALPESPAVPTTIAADLDAQVLYDEPGDGRLWARGASWKASFGSEGAVYFPRVGPDEPRSLPHSLSPDSVTIGEVPVAFDRASAFARSGDRVTCDRGAFIEAYDLVPGSVEQSFVFDVLPRSGDLVLHIPVSSELEAVETDSGLEFRSAQGRVGYSRAVAVDARGRRTPVATRIEDGAITLRVGAGVLADAVLPLVIDPVLTAIFPDSTTADTFSTDSAYDPFNGVWVFVYEQVFSASDHDVYVKEYPANGGPAIASTTVDFTGDSWVRPRVADLAFPHLFLAVAGVTASSNGARTVKGRTVQPNGTLLTLSAQFSISGSLTGSCIRPVVGGDPFPGTSAFWCVAFEHDNTSGTRQIAYCLVDASAFVTAGPIHLAGTTDESPSISKSNDTSIWLLSWLRTTSLTKHIEAAQIMWNGSAISGPFDVAVGTFFGTPSSSSPLSGTQITAVTYQGGIHVGSQDSTIVVALLDGPTVLQVVDLMALEHSTTSAQDETAPSVDSDGSHFLVAYSEFDPAFSHYELFATDLAVAGNTLQPVQSHVELQPGLGQTQLASSVAAARAGGSLAHRYLVTYDIRQNDQDHDVAGRFFDGLEGGTASPFCFGDGTGTACPCGNSGGPGRGCANSVSSSGSGLTLSSGVVSSLADTAVLQANGVPGGASCLFFQGTGAGVGAPFGDGLRCATGSVIRIAPKHANSLGIATYPEAGDPSLTLQGGVPPQGGLRTYQLWYRNSAVFCTSATFNLSNGLAVQWAP
jgi:hypothetical protein